MQGIIKLSLTKEIILNILMQEKYAQTRKTIYLKYNRDLSTRNKGVTFHHFYEVLEDLYLTGLIQKIRIPSKYTNAVGYQIAKKGIKIMEST